MSTAGEDYRKHFDAFVKDVWFGARALQYHISLNEKVASNPRISKAINANPRFWLDFRFSNLTIAIISLGRVFDDDQSAHSITKMLQKAALNLDFFSKESLRARKQIHISDPYDLDRYIENAHELEQEDIKAIQSRRKEAQKLWRNIKPLRDKILAHSEIMSEEERTQIYKDIKYKDVSEVMEILVTIAHVLEQAELNGRKPDFNERFRGPMLVAEAELAKILDSLIFEK